MAKDYDPNEVSLIIGSHIAGGFADGTFLTVARNNDLFTLAVGASGEAARSKSNDRSGRFTLTLMQSSETNDILNGFAAADERGNAGKFPVLVKDNNGNAIYEATEAWVVKKPDSGYAKEIENREWIIETGELIHETGGIPA